MDSLRDQNVLILGLGASGLAMARWCARAGAQVTVADTRPNPPQLAALAQELPSARFLCAALEPALLQSTGARALFKSPGLSPLQLAALLQAAAKLGLWQSGELGLFARALRSLKAQRAYAPTVLAVTGTNGKTTVTALAGQLLERAGQTVAVAGNIGPTLLDTLVQRLDANSLPEAWVLELSSFQLDAETMFEPSAGALLNITQDHLDWHGSMAGYSAAKANVFGQHGLLVLNRDEPAVMALLPAPVRVKQRLQQRRWVTFGSDLPRRAGDFGLEQSGGMLWLVAAQSALAGAKADPDEELFLQRLMPADALQIRGRHNALNALAALALARAGGAALAPMLRALRDYRGEPHRVESVGVFAAVEYFDDSKGTNVGATVAALKGLGPERKLVVMLGGEGKGQDFTPLAQPLCAYARAVILIGRDAPLIRAALASVEIPLLDAASMAQAVALARAQAQPGDAVLMSPACASFDMFDNYEHRAREFRQAVLALPAGASMGAVA